jgi:hypothetical protein
MAILRFLFDEDTDPDWISALLQEEPGIDVLRVGDLGAPPFRTKDPDLLVEAENLGRVLVSRDRKTIPVHLARHFAAGYHTHGVILLREGFPMATYVQDLLLIWHATTADEWIDRTDYVPY